MEAGSTFLQACRRNRMVISPGSGTATRLLSTQEIWAPSEGKYTRTSPTCHRDEEPLLKTTVPNQSLGCLTLFYSRSHTNLSVVYL